MMSLISVATQPRGHPGSGSRDNSGNITTTASSRTMARSRQTSVFIPTPLLELACTRSKTWRIGDRMKAQLLPPRSKIHTPRIGRATAFGARSDGETLQRPAQFVINSPRTLDASANTKLQISKTAAWSGICTPQEQDQKHRG